MQTIYRVDFTNPSGRFVQTKVILSEGYTTFADIPRILEIKYGAGCIIDSAVRTDI